ncbi:hypothetical protein FN846DRAFT_960443, partial [Sphaerosporella brunnea]
IKSQINRPRSTIHNFLQRYKERGSYKNLRISSRPPLITKHDGQKLLYEASRDRRRRPFSELRNKVVPTVLVRTRPRLTAEAARLRLAWALAHADWTKEAFRKVVWSDECTAEKSQDPRTDWVFRTAHEKWHKDCVQTYEKGPGAKFMVWPKSRGCGPGKI